MSLSEVKVRHMKALSNKQGVIAAAAMDQRGSLKKSIASAKGIPAEQVPGYCWLTKRAAMTIPSPAAYPIFCRTSLRNESPIGAPTPSRF